MHSGRVPLLLLGRSHLYRFIQIFLKFAKIYDKILKIFVKNWPDQILVKAQSKESKKLPPHYSEKVKTKIQQSPGQPAKQETAAAENNKNIHRHTTQLAHPGFISLHAVFPPLYALSSSRNNNNFLK